MPIVQCVPVERQVASDRDGRLESALRRFDGVLSRLLPGLVVSVARDEEGEGESRGAKDAHNAAHQRPKIGHVAGMRRRGR